MINMETPDPLKTSEKFDLKFTIEEMINLYGINSFEDLDSID